MDNNCLELVRELENKLNRSLTKEEKQFVKWMLNKKVQGQKHQKN